MNSSTRTLGDPAPRGFFVVAALLFLGSAAITMSWCASMSAMPCMPWMRMPGQTWPGVAAEFLGMWTVMMIAMMLPALLPLLWRFRQAVSRPGINPDSLTTVVALGYFAVWTLSGAVAFPLGVALAAAEMQSPALAHAVPVVSGLIVVMAGALQLTRWKAQRLECCAGSGVRRLMVPVNASTAWRHGSRLGIDCFVCCLPLTAVLFVTGVMDLRAMALVTAAITAERLAPGGKYLARLTGLALLAGWSIYLSALAGGVRSTG